jgi:hypothetical protein
MGTLPVVRELVVIVMDDGLAAVAVLVFLFDDGRAVAGFSLLHDGLTIAVAIVIVTVSDGNARSHRADTNADVIGHRGTSKYRDRCRNEKYLLHGKILSDGRAVLSILDSD